MESGRLINRESDWKITEATEGAGRRDLSLF